MRNGITPIDAVFVDTSAFFAPAFSRSLDPDQAFAVMAMLRTAKRRLVTTDLIMAESHALALARRGRNFALELIGEVARGSTLVVRVTEEDEERAIAILHRYADKDFSYTDAPSFSVVDRLNIADSFAFDRHFAQCGPTLVGPDRP